MHHSPNFSFSSLFCSAVKCNISSPCFPLIALIHEQRFLLKYCMFMYKRMCVQQVNAKVFRISHVACSPFHGDKYKIQKYKYKLFHAFLHELGGERGHAEERRILGLIQDKIQIRRLPNCSSSHLNNGGGLSRPRRAQDEEAVRRAHRQVHRPSLRGVGGEVSIPQPRGMRER